MAKRKDPLAWGIILIIIGLIFILENLHIRVWNLAWRFWPVILIIWGASKLLEGLKSRAENPAKPQPPTSPQD
jgi:hypothetical protein